MPGSASGTRREGRLAYHSSQLCCILFTASCVRATRGATAPLAARARYPVNMPVLACWIFPHAPRADRSGPSRRGLAAGEREASLARRPAVDGPLRAARLHARDEENGGKARTKERLE